MYNEEHILLLDNVSCASSPEELVEAVNDTGYKEQVSDSDAQKIDKEIMDDGSLSMAYRSYTRRLNLCQKIAVRENPSVSEQYLRCDAPSWGYNPGTSYAAHAGDDAATGVCALMKDHEGEIIAIDERSDEAIPLKNTDCETITLDEAKELLKAQPQHQIETEIENERLENLCRHFTANNMRCRSSIFDHETPYKCYHGKEYKESTPSPMPSADEFAESTELTVPRDEIPSPRRAEMTSSADRIVDEDEESEEPECIHNDDCAEGHTGVCNDGACYYDAEMHGGRVHHRIHFETPVTFNTNVLRQLVEDVIKRSFGQPNVELDEFSLNVD